MKKLILALLALSWASFPSRAETPNFRIELFSNRVVKSLSVQATRQSVKLCDAKSEKRCVLVPPGQSTTCLADGIVRCRFGGSNPRFARLVINSAAPVRVVPSFDGKNGPSTTVLIPNADIDVADGRLQVVTVLDLDSYVSGVLKGEASVLEAPAARQAMAILARTWALRWKGRHSQQGYDFCSLTHCQVFDPAQAAEEYGADSPDEAVRSTRGRVLKFHGELADPYFTACCGGRTEAAGNVWPDRAQPYLISIRDPYCLSNRHASWNKSLPAESVRQVLSETLHLPLSGELSEISVVKRDASGRALVLRVVAGSSWNIDANQFRYAIGRRLGWGMVQSNLYVIQRQGDFWVFSGHGLGHGVGLCQAGAEQMARMGASAERILHTYFPGTEIASISTAEPDPIASSEHFELQYPLSQQTWVNQALEMLERWRRELGAHAEVLPPRVRVETWATTEGFIHATGEPGWMAAASDGFSISMQPLGLLARKQILDQTLRHELTHLVVHRLRAKDVPRWFEEGCVLYLTEERIDTPVNERMSASELEAAVANPGSEAQMRTAYTQALERVRRFAQRQGDAALWHALMHPDAEVMRWFQD